MPTVDWATQFKCTQEVGRRQTTGPTVQLLYYHVAASSSWSTSQTRVDPKRKYHKNTTFINAQQGSSNPDVLIHDRLSTINVSTMDRNGFAHPS